MKLTRINTRFIFSLTSTALIAGNAAFAQLGQSEWQTPGGGSTSTSNSAPAQGLGQSDWQTPSGNSGGGGQSQLGQSGWQQPPGQQQLQQFQTAPQQQQQQPQQLGQSNWQQPASSNQLGQSDWQQPAAPANNQLGQSGWQQPAPSQPLQGSASTTTTLGDALKSGQGNSANSDIDPAAAAMMMSQLNGGANGAGMNMGATGGAMNPAAMMMGGGMGGADPMAAMSQLAPALGALMMVMPNNNNGMNTGMPSSRPFTGGFAVPRRSGTVYNNNNNGGIGKTVNKVLPPSMVQGMMRQMMYQGMSRAMYH
ncbi:MAG: hypothetical protein P4L53_02380 [Candidatus Obscuribacterales bacterium]|nr:hypothetical protein [Candidatus Obscuribacterales bacterium]